MSDGVRCFFVNGGTEGVDLGVAAGNYDNVYCSGCSNHYECKTLIEGAGQKPIEEADFRYHGKVDNEGPDA